MKKIILFAISAYQHLFSLDQGMPVELRTHCKYEPRCSVYFSKAIKKKGVLLGLTYGMWRIIRCNPLSRGGLDDI
jgi:putative membrane protein insertion efficiency factor